MNKVFLVGRLTADPEVRATQDGKTVASYTLAVDRRAARAEQQADFIRCVSWEKRAEFAEKYLRKGSKIAVTGRIQTGSYEKNGKKVYTTDIVVEECEFADSKQAAPRTDKGFQDAGGFAQVGEQEELPFN